MIDHLIWGVPALVAGVESIARRSGVVIEPGGRHPGAGTANAITGLGPSTYLEILGPDPTAGERVGAGARLAALSGPRLIGWAARTDNAETTAAAAARAGLRPAIVPLQRSTPAGETLSFRLVFVSGHDGGALVPFLVDWGDTPHPAGAAPGGLTLVELRVETRRPEAVRPVLDALGLGTAVDVDVGPMPRLSAVITGPGGALVLDGTPMDLFGPDLEPDDDAPAGAARAGSRARR